MFMLHTSCADEVMSYHYSRLPASISLNVFGHVLGVVQELHNALWNKPWDTMLLDESDDSAESFKYLPNEHIEKLQLVDLGYDESVLLVRAEYISAFYELQSRSSSPGRGGGIVVTGQPGIGMWPSPIKSSFLLRLGRQSITKGRPRSSSTFCFAV
jgi:hypothetical protein